MRRSPAVAVVLDRERNGAVRRCAVEQSCDFSLALHRLHGTQSDARTSERAMILRMSVVVRSAFCLVACGKVTETATEKVIESKLSKDGTRPRST
jgi:hypothetical protein